MTEHSHEGRTPRRNPEQRDARPRRPLREVVSDLDHDILRLLLRRHNLLTRMRGDKPRLEPAEEKFLRESWEAAAARVSRDPRLTGHFFSLMQEVVFQPRPVAPDAQENGADQRPEPPRTAFNLAPPARPVKLDCTAPLACRVTRAWLFLAATSGRPLCLAPCLMNDPIVDCVQMLTQAGAALTRTDDGVLAREAAPLGTPDKVLHAGDSAWNFFLLLGHYLGRPSRVKITGGSGLKLADFTTLRHVLPALGARLVHAVPKSTGLPVRLECSGLLPDAFTLPADVPVELAEALLLAAPGYERPLLVDLSAHPDQATALARVLPVLRAAGAAVQADGGRVRVTPGPLNFPESPELPLEPELAVVLLALPLALGGSARLTGLWPRWPAAVAGWDLLQALGLDLRQDTRKEHGEIVAQNAVPVHVFDLAALPVHFPADWAALPLALAACAALRGGEVRLPALSGGVDPAEVESFLRAAGCDLRDDGRLCKKEQCGQETPWNAPSPVWALGLALAACARPHRKLGNPGVMTELYPAFWALYNSLPEPALRRQPPPAATPEAPRRRRIHTASVAVPPELPPDEEW